MSIDGIAFRAVCCGFFLICMLSCTATADPTLKVTSEGPYQPGATQQFVLHSARLGHDILVVVSAPPSTALLTPGQKLPAIYTLDSGYNIAGPIAQMMTWGAIMSSAYVISVGYPDGGANERDADLLHHQTVRDGKIIGGSGATFQKFLTDELRPFLEARYPLDASRAVLFGHSYGGLFAANVLATAPDSFFGYIIASPSVPADPQVIGKLATIVPSGGTIQTCAFVGVAGAAELVLSPAGRAERGLDVGANRWAYRYWRVRFSIDAVEHLTLRSRRTNFWHGACAVDGKTKTNRRDKLFRAFHGVPALRSTGWRSGGHPAA